MALVEAWTETPDLVTANQGEDGILELCELLVARGIGIEAGLLSLDDARRFVAADIAARCVRAMVEPLDADPDMAVAHAEAIERTLAAAGVTLEQVHQRRRHRVLGGQSAGNPPRARHPDRSGGHARPARRAHSRRQRRSRCRCRRRACPERALVIKHRAWQRQTAAIRPWCWVTRAKPTLDRDVTKCLDPTDSSR
jgi:hypothetical protein